MSLKFRYYRLDIEKWLSENEEEIKNADTPEEFAENAVKYHNSKRCTCRCQCIDSETYEIVSPKLSTCDQQKFKEIIAERIGIKWGVWTLT